ncbi:hypothetical protein ASD85_27550 [Rhizobium sp. Root651]|nr:hypothetical protein ASD85_27550 [Rhizobium sp. Root651]
MLEVDLGAAVGQEAFEDVTTLESVAESFGEFGFSGYSRKCRLPKNEEITNNLHRAFLSGCDTRFGMLATNGFFDLPKLCTSLKRRAAARL